jgi:hypothetical protein
MHQKLAYVDSQQGPVFIAAAASCLLIQWICLSPNTRHTFSFQDRMVYSIRSAQPTDALYEGPGYHPETPILARDVVECQYGSRDDNQTNMEMPMY